MTATDQNKLSIDQPEETLWQNKNFLKFWVGETLSLYGAQVTTLALPLAAIYVFDATDEQVGLLRFVQLVPYLGLALVFGVLVDRARKRPVLIWTNVARLVLLTLIPVLYWLDVLSMGSLLVIACAIGVASVLFDVTWMSYVPVLVKNPKQYVEASSKMGISYSSSDVVGPALGGTLVQLLGAPIALLADAFSYLGSVISLWLIRTDEPEPSPQGPKRRLLVELREGTQFVFKHQVLRPLAFIAPFCNFSMVTVQTMFVIYATKVLNLDGALIGAIFAAGAVGGLIGATLAPKIIKGFPIGLVYLVSMSAIFLGPGLIPLASGPRPLMLVLLGLSFFVSLAGLGVAGVVMVSLRQTCTPQSKMGRMSAVFRTLLFGGGAFGGLFAGLLAGGIGAKNALIVAAVGSAFVVIGLLVSPISRLREMPPAATDPEVVTTQLEATQDTAKTNKADESVTTER